MRSTAGVFANTWVTPGFCGVRVAYFFCLFSVFFAFFLFVLCLVRIVMTTVEFVVAMTST
jgi:hypothetical protein